MADLKAVSTPNAEQRSFRSERCSQSSLRLLQRRSFDILRSITIWPALSIWMIAALLTITSTPARGQSNTIRYPAPIESNEFEGSLGVSVTVLPQLLVENELRQTPLLEGHLRYGLPLNFSVEAGVKSNVITTLAELQARWGLDLDPFAFGLTDRFSFWYGFATFSGFDIDVQGWLNFPGVELGYTVGDVAISSRAELQLVTSLIIETDGIRTDSSQNFVAGYALSFSVEQPFWGKSYLGLGMTLNYSHSLYQAWLAFNSFEEYLLFPEFSIGILF